MRRGCRGGGRPAQRLLGLGSPALVRPVRAVPRAGGGASGHSVIEVGGVALLPGRAAAELVLHEQCGGGVEGEGFQLGGKAGGVRGQRFQDVSSRTRPLGPSTDLVISRDGSHG